MKDRTILLVDIIGALVVATTIVGAGWYVFIKPDTASSQLHALSADVRQLQVDQSQMRTVLDAQKTTRLAVLASADELGQLPDESPIDQDLKKITSIASDNGIKILEVIPVATVRYPSILELRYKIKAEGSFPGHVRFLRDYEACSFWSDMTYLSMVETMGETGAEGPNRQSELTVSFFSSYQ